MKRFLFRALAAYQCARLGHGNPWFRAGRLTAGYYNGSCSPSYVAAALEDDAQFWEA